ncbi:AAA family ATPase [bacterium]|nr:AAA family ATPase [bacterium]
MDKIPMIQRTLSAVSKPAEPPRLYERDRYISKLNDHFNEVKNDACRFVFLSGPPGIGKTALVWSLESTVVEANGFFTSGKFDQFNKDIPYSAMSEAFDGLILKILTQHEDIVKNWKTKFSETLGNHLRIISDLVPAMNLVVGPTEPVSQLSPAQNEFRLRYFFEKFIKTFASPERPLVLFLDDIHWCDRETMQFLEFLAEQGGIPNCFIIGAFRTAEMDKPFLDRIAKYEQITDFVELETLSEPSVREWVNETLQNPAQDLSTLLYQKTKGNPLFVQQILKDFKTTISDHDSTCPLIDGLKIPQDTRESLADWILHRILDLPHETLTVLKTAACIGSSFSLEMLSNILDKEQNELQEILDSAQTEEVIIKDQDRFKFFHDRVRETIYNTIDTEFRKQIQIKIGRLIWRQSDAKSLDDVVFEIADRMNDALSLITEPAEKAELMSLNLQAGNKAKRSTAFGKALQYYDMSLWLLAADPWVSLHDLCLQVHSGIMECRFMTGDEAGCRTSFEHILQNANSDLEKIRMHGILITLYSNAGKNSQAIEIGRQCLESIGIKFPTSGLSVWRQVLKLQFLMFRKKTTLADIKQMSDAQIIEVMEVLRTLISSSFTPNNQVVFAWVVLSMVNLSLQHGQAPQTSISFALYGMFLAGQMKYREAISFGTVALEFAAKHDYSQVGGGVLLAYGAFVGVYHEPLRSTMLLLERAEKEAAKVGDIQYMGFSRFQYVTQKIMSGCNLDEYIRETEVAMEFCRRIGHKDGYLSFTFFSAPFYSLVGKEKSIENSKLENPVYGYNYRIGKIAVSAILGDFLTLCTEAETIEKTVKSVPGMGPPEIAFYYALALSALCASSSDKAKSLLRIRKSQKYLKELSQFCPDNFLHKYLLVSAEIARLTKRKEKAMRLYDEAIQSAKRNEFLHCEALANEFAARFYLSDEYEAIGRTYMIEAYKCYARWGATAKIKMMYEQYPGWLSAVPSEERKSISAGPDHADVVKGIASHFELLSVLEASYDISSEMQLDKLLEKLINHAVKYSGAERSFLTIEQENDKILVAETNRIGPITIKHLENMAYHDEFPWSVLNYVKHTIKPIVSAKAFEDELFNRDSYIRSNHVQSVLCVPILKQGSFIGSFYLENNSVEEAFTLERIEIVKLLSAQAAIAIENAKLYEAIEKSRDKYRTIFQMAGVSILEEDFSLIIAEIESLKTAGVVKFDEYFDRHPEFVERMTALLILRDVNEAALRMYEARDKTEFRKSLTQIFMPESYAVFKNLLIAIVEGQSNFEAEATNKTLSGRPFDILVTVVIPTSSAGYHNVLVCIFDITQRKKSQRAMEASREELRNLTHHLQTVREEEQSRMSREIHDQLGSDLTALKYQLALMQKQVPETGQFRSQADHISSAIDRSIRKVQKLADELRPGILDNLGLTEAIQWQAEEFEKRTQIICRVSVIECFNPERSMATAGFRIVQELLTNVARHADASEVFISIEREEKAYVIEVEDNGKGIEDHKIQDPRSIGFIGIGGRLREFRGSFAVQNSGHGTVVRVLFPISQEVGL